MSEEAVMKMLDEISKEVTDIHTYQKTHFNTLTDHEARIRSNEEKTLKHSVYAGMASFFSGAFIVSLIAYFTKGGSA